MPKRSTKSDRQSQHKNLKKLKEHDLYRGRTDARKKVTKYQKTILQKFGDFLKGVAKVLFPSKPKSYKGADGFIVNRKAVVVPTPKGTTARVNKSGEIETTRRGPRGEKITSTIKPGIPPAPPPERRVQYFVPFARRVGHRKYAMHWIRFPNYDELQKFMQEYEPDRYGDWREYVIEEEVGFDEGLSHTARNARLDKELERRGLVQNADEIVSGARRLDAVGKRRRGRSRRG